MDRVTVVGNGVPGGGLEFAVSLVYKDHIGQFDDALLHTLQFIATRRRQQQHEHIGHILNGRLRLPYTNRLH